jgi:hypothetical protein
MTYHQNSHLQDNVLKMIYFHINWQECEKTKTENIHTIEITKLWTAVYKLEQEKVLVG